MGAMAGKYLKRSVLELGGSDPFCVLQYADIDRATDLGIKIKFFLSNLKQNNKLWIGLLLSKKIYYP